MFKIKFLLIATALLITACEQPIQLAPDAILPDGGVYQGGFKDGIFHGEGSLTYKSGSYYQGQFENGLYHGQGVLLLAGGSRYEGNFNKGDISGQFAFANRHSDVKYQGEMLQGFMHGYGELITDDYVYVGNFERGEFEGQGKISYTEGIVYEGQFSKSEYNGRGVFLDDDGSRYEGEFKDHFYHGQGKVVYEDGGVYEGEFAAGEYRGQGRYSRDEAWYEGEYEQGEITSGEYRDFQANRYKGEIESWQPHGDGQMTYADGSVAKGTFSYGSLTGEGELTSAEGDHYEGSFEYNQYDGFGVLTTVDGSVYEGEFSYGQYHGEGTLSTLDPATQNTSVTIGRWSRGQLAYNAKTGERQHEQADLALENHQALLNKSLASLKPTDDNSNLYFLGVAGDGRQSVFRREVEFVAQQIEKRYATQGRSVSLINDHKTAQKYPLATSRSIASSIKSIGEKMNIEDDVLFLYLTSHGSKKHDFSLRHDSIRLPDFGPKELKLMLDSAQIKWRVILVSACYSGGFIPELSGPNTLLITAADSKSTSFGCADDSEMTHFAKALFQEVLAKDDEVELDRAFCQSKRHYFAVGRRARA